MSTKTSIPYNIACWPAGSVIVPISLPWVTASGHLRLEWRRQLSDRRISCTLFACHGLTSGGKLPIDATSGLRCDRSMTREARRSIADTPPGTATCQPLLVMTTTSRKQMTWRVPYDAYSGPVVVGPMSPCSPAPTRASWFRNSVSRSEDSCPRY